MFKTIFSLIAGIFGGHGDDPEDTEIEDTTVDLDGDGTPDKYDINPYAQDSQEDDQND